MCKFLYVLIAYICSYYAFGISFGFVLTLTLLPNLWVSYIFLDTLPFNLFCLASAMLGVGFSSKLGQKLTVFVIAVIAFLFTVTLWSNFLVIDAEHRLAATSSVLSMLIGTFTGVIARRNT